MNPRYGDVAPRAAHRCEYCHAPEWVFNSPFEVEHITPTSRGGADVETNWALACRSCNLHKGSFVHATDPESGDEICLFHQRTDRWHQHFRVEAGTGSVVGMTPIGRATVACLAMNSPRQMGARRQWMRLGLFP